MGYVVGWGKSRLAVLLGDVLSSNSPAIRGTALASLANRCNLRSTYTIIYKVWLWGNHF